MSEAHSSSARASANRIFGPREDTALYLLMGWVGMIAIGPLSAAIAPGGITLLLLIFAWGFGSRQPRVNRLEGGVLISTYIAYTVYLIMTSTSA